MWWFTGCVVCACEVSPEVEDIVAYEIGVLCVSPVSLQVPFRTDAGSGYCVESRYVSQVFDIIHLTTINCTTQCIVFIGILTTTLFTILVYFASFIATYFIPPPPAFPLENYDEVQSSYRFSFFYGYWISPFDVAKDLIRIMYRVLQDEDILLSTSSSPGYTSPLRSTSPLQYSPPAPPGFFGSLFRRIILGIPVVGVASLVQMLWSVSMLGPFHWMTRWRNMGGGTGTGSRRSRSRDIATLLILVAVIGGALR